MNEEDREKLKGRLAELGQERLELQRNLMQIRQTEQTLIGRLDQNEGAQKELQRMLEDQGEDKAGDKEALVEPENKPGAKGPKKPAAPG